MTSRVLLLCATWAATGLLIGCGPDTAWSRVSSGTSGESFHTIASSSEDFAIAGGLLETAHWNGERWRRYEDPPSSLRQIRMGHGQTWGVALYHTYRLEGDLWLPIEVRGILNPWEVRPLPGGSALALYSGGADLWDGTEWRSAPGPNTNSAHFLWAASQDEYWIAEKQSSGSVLERVFWVKDGVSTEVTPEGVGASLAWMGLEGSGSTPWIFGTLGGDVINRVYRWTGSGWTEVDVGDRVLRHLHPLDAERAVAVGDGGSIVWLTSNGPVVSVPAGEGGRDLTAVGGSSPTDLWAVGEEGTILRFDPTFEE